MKKDKKKFGVKMGTEFDLSTPLWVQ